MSFFDSKQEVLQIELTPYGRYLLSRGKFDPKYYAFFDDDILYDSQYAHFSESQNYSQERILNETPILKPQSNFDSVKLAEDETYEHIISEEGEVADSSKLIANIQYSIGNCDINSDYAPAWNIRCLTNNISSSQILSYSNSGSYTRIPQINMKTGSFILRGVTDITTIEEKEETFAITQTQNSLTYIFSSKQDLQTVFSIIEKNTVDMKENFEIEVFKEEKTTDNKNIWKQLYFLKKPTNIQNNILLDEYLYEDNFSKAPNKSNVEHYFDIYVDTEIVDTMVPEEIAKEIYGTSITDKDKPFGDKC